MKRTILDIGSNVGNHSIYFSKYFKSVQSFDPNPKLWKQFEENVKINNSANITLHKLGLGDTSAELPFFDIASDNQGLGTVVRAEQYDRPLRQIATVKVEHGDALMQLHGVRDIDAIKIDVQGFEPEVLAGLRSTLLRDKPVVWMEIGAGTSMKLERLDVLESLFPYPIRLLRFETTRQFSGYRTSLVPATGSVLPVGDYVVVPEDSRPASR